MPTVEAEPIVSTARRRGFNEQDQTEALLALKANRGNVSKTARELGMSDETLRQWARGIRRSIDPAVMDAVKSEMSDGFASLARQALRQARRKVSEMSGSAATIAAAVATDKFLLLNGQGPGGHNLTVNVSNTTVNVTPAELSPQALQDALGLLSRALALPSPSEAQEGAIVNECGPSESASVLASAT